VHISHQYLLDQMSTPKGKDSCSGGSSSISNRMSFGIGSGGKRNDLAIGSEIKKDWPKSSFILEQVKNESQKSSQGYQDKCRQD